MSLTTVSRLLAKFSLSFYVAKIKPKLTEKHKLESLNFARMNLKQPIEYWRTFQYTDEYRSKCYANRAGRVLRTPKDEWNPKYFLRSVKYGLFSCMIYSTISYRYKGPLWFMPCGTTMNSIVNSQVLRQVTLPALQQHNLKLQQDNAPIHFSKYMKNFYTANNIELYRFPVMSPDLNPLFHCWNPLKSNISPEECTTYDLLNEEVKRALEQISLDIINHLIDSMPKRLEEVIKQKGDATKH
ncbi:DDE_superfamily endonuclease domain-containing protein [Hexamita inflata]|uniref:DDE superfamily endonuclease domain-containing protein n=1 Tax=Hexamita inflata TaxID=28002 RepID=A0AA86UC89_9EUKA|nr:DDE superfamily endonuclease domain-containing protein [Hexamita inflata]